MSKNNLPEFLFKYKSLTDDEQLRYTIDIIKNSQIYLPTPRKLNDAFECPNIAISLGIAGSGIYTALKKHHPIIEGIIDSFKILSLSNSGVNPVLWAHYTNNYQGICLVFKNKGSFDSCVKVDYKQNIIQNFFESDIGDYEKTIYNSLTTKQNLWSYENEYRMVTNTDKTFLNFQRHELYGIIIGHNTNKENKFALLSTIKKYNSNMKVFKTYIADIEGKVVLLNYRYKIQFDGSELKTIDL